MRRAQQRREASPHISRPRTYTIQLVFLGVDRIAVKSAVDVWTYFWLCYADCPFLDTVDAAPAASFGVRTPRAKRAPLLLFDRIIKSAVAEAW